MKQTSNSILQSLKKIFTKMTGKKVVKSKTETDLISDIAEAYEPVDTSGLQEKLIAGEGISIAEDGKTISASGGSKTYKYLYRLKFVESDTNTYFTVALVYTNTKYNIVNNNFTSYQNYADFIDAETDDNVGSFKGICCYGHYQQMFYNAGTSQAWLYSLIGSGASINTEYTNIYVEEIEL